MQVIEHYIVPPRPFVSVPTQYHAEVAVSHDKQDELPQWTLMGGLCTITLTIMFFMFMIVIDCERK